MATIKLVAGAQSGFASLMTTELNSLVTGNAIIGSTSIANATNLDLEIELSFTTGGSITPSGSPFVAVYLYPLNGDGTSYGDGRFGSSAAGPPPSNYYQGFCGLPATAGTQTGTFGIPFLGTRILLPNGTFKPVFYNNTGVTLSSSGNILYYRTTDRSVA
jgi:hypothetical protein